MIRIRNSAGTKEIIFDNQCYTLNTKDLGAANAKLTSSNGINQVGEYISHTAIEGRNINLIGFILADTDTEMEFRKRDLFNIVNPLENFYLIVDNTKLTVKSTDTVKFAVNQYENNKRLVKFNLKGYCANPCFEPLEETHINVALWRPMFHFPLITTTPIIMGLKEPRLIANVLNNGDIETGMVIEFRAKAALTNPSLMDLNTYKKIKLNKAMVAGERIVIDTNYGRKTITGYIGSTATNYFSYLDLDNSDFLQLITGNNELKYDADTNMDNLEVSITFIPKYLGV
ncbi:MAG: phage tail family protein [Oscillospiraceae bacterium]|nr:phage tail family protein [Oscillospiraceae bacterium]